MSYLIGRYCAKQALNQQFHGTKMSDILISSGVLGQPIVHSLQLMTVSIAHSQNLGIALAFERRV